MDFLPEEIHHSQDQLFPFRALASSLPIPPFTALSLFTGPRRPIVSIPPYLPHLTVSHCMHSSKTSLASHSKPSVVLPSKQRIASLNELLELEQRRESLHIELDQLLQKIGALEATLFSDSCGMPYRAAHLIPLPGHTAQSHQPSSPVSISRKRQPSKGTHLPRRASSAQRGLLKQQILNALQSAGDQGITIKNLATELRVRPVNIHSWFHSALSKYPQIRKSAPGCYHWTYTEGELSTPASNAPSSPSIAETSPRPVPPSPRGGRSRSRAKRGEVTRQILTLLHHSGLQGISVRAIAESIHSHYRNVHVWFASTGKRFPEIQKLSRGVYRLSPSLDRAEITR